jgi:hypothetical protein
MTPAERSYCRAVEVADRLLSNGVPILGVSGSLDGATCTLRLIVGPDRPAKTLTLPAEANIMAWADAARSALGEKGAASG